MTPPPTLLASRPRAQRGAALLTAMVIVTVVASLAAGMVWQQWKAVQVETAERARSQSYWLLTGALDWARLILREDQLSSKVDHLGEPWAVPLAEARLSTFLAADKNNTDLEGVEAFLSGRIEDLQARYNLRNLVAEGKLVEEEVKTLARLCDIAKAPSGTADAIAEGMLRSQSAAAPPEPGSSQTSVASAEAGTLLPPRTIEDLIWFGLTPQTVAQLKPFVTLLQPGAPGQGTKHSTLNLNTASKEVIGAVLGVDQGSAQRLVQARQSQPLKDEGELSAVVTGQGLKWTGRIGFASNNFEVTGRLRYENLVIEERSLVVREGRGIVKTWHRERINTVLGTPAPR